MSLNCPAAHPSDQHFDFAIVGMGIGGLTLGALLAQAGKTVVIFDQHYVPGGYGHTFRQGRFSFCAELHYVWDCGVGQRVYQMLEKLGLEHQVTFRRLDPNGFDRIIAPGVDYTIGSGFSREPRRRLMVSSAWGRRRSQCSRGKSGSSVARMETRWFLMVQIALSAALARWLPGGHFSSFIP